MTDTLELDRTATRTALVICHCMQITESEVVSAIETFGLDSVDQVRRCTGAGDGCTSCHSRLHDCLERHAGAGASSALPMFSDK